MFLKLQSTGNNEFYLKQVAFIFVCLIFIFESYVLNASYSEYLIFLTDTHFFTDGVVIVCLIIFSHYLFFRFAILAFSSGWVYKIFCLLIFSFAVFFEYGYQKALGRFSTAFDVGNITATTSEQKIASFFLYFDIFALIPCLFFLGFLIAVKKPLAPKKFQNFFKTVSLFIVFFCGLSLLSSLFIEKKFPMVSLNAFCRTSTDFLIFGALSDGNSFLGSTPVSRRQVQKPNLPINFSPSNNIVVIIDESVRGDHLSLNGYHRETTPFLEKLRNQGILHNWGIAAAASTGSRFSFNAMITGITPDDLPDKTEFKIKSFPTVFQFAKAMGYKTYFFDAQMKSYWGANEEDKNYLDTWTGVDRLSNNGFIEKWAVDNQIAKQVNGIISASTGNFIFIFKHGSHIPYQENFPSDQKVWQPSYETENKFTIPDSTQVDEVTNAYDNSLKYNVDSFFKNLVGDYSKIPNNSVIIYTGDHGQTLFANGKSSHGGMTKDEANVPLFIIGKLANNIDTGYKASHSNLFPTLLDLMNFPDEIREKKNSLSLLKAKRSDSKRRFFNPDLDVKVPFD